MARVHALIEENIDKLYENRPRPQKEARFLQKSRLYLKSGPMNVSDDLKESIKPIDIESLPEEMRTFR